MIRSEEDAHSTATDQNPSDLGPLVAHFEQRERDDHNTDYGPKVQELRGEQVRVAVCEDGEVISFDIHEGQNDVFPTINE